MQGWDSGLTPQGGPASQVVLDFTVGLQNQGVE